MCQCWQRDNSQKNSPAEGKRFGKSKGLEQLTLRSLQSKNRQETDNRREDSGHDSRSHLCGPFIDSRQQVFVLGAVFHAVHDTFRQDNPHIHHGADGDGDTRKGDDIGIHPGIAHDDEGKKHTDGQQSRHDQGSPQVKQQNDNHDGGDQNFLCQVAVQCPDGFPNQFAAVVERHDMHPGDGSVFQHFGGKTGLQLGDFFADAFYDVQRVGAKAGHHDPSDGFSA